MERVHDDRPDAGSTSRNRETIYLLSARLVNAFGCCCAVFACVWLAGFAASQVAKEHREHLQAGGPVFAVFIGILVLVAAVMAYRALRAARLGVRATDSGIIIRNMNRDLRIGWSDIRQFEATPATHGYFKMAIGQVKLTDGTAQVIQGTEVQLAAWQQRNVRLDQCVIRLNGILAGALGSSAGSR
jgi:hypothetical protein